MPIIISRKEHVQFPPRDHFFSLLRHILRCAHDTEHISKLTSRLCPAMGRICPLPLCSWRCLCTAPGSPPPALLQPCATYYYNQPHLFPVLSASVVAAGTSPTSSGSAFKGICLESSPSQHFSRLQSEISRVLVEVLLLSEVKLGRVKPEGSFTVKVSSPWMRAVKNTHSVSPRDNCALLILLVIREGMSKIMWLALPAVCFSSCQGVALLPWAPQSHHQGSSS